MRAYDFRYGTGLGTGRTLLTSVRECAPDHRCKPPTRFGYGGGKPGFTAAKTGVPIPFATMASPMLLDVTGDGLDDLVIPDTFDMGNPASKGVIPVGMGTLPTYWNLAVNRGKSGLHRFAPAVSAKETDAHVADPQKQMLTEGLATAIPAEMGTALDYDQDGRMDVFLHDGFGSWPTWQVLLTQPDHSFKAHDTGIPRPDLLGTRTPGLVDPDASVHLADVDGDGVPDLIQCENKTPSSPGLNDFHWELHRWTPAGPGWELAGTPIDRLYTYPCNTELYTVDVNGDGKVDLVVKSAGRFNDNSLLYYTTYDAFTREDDATWPNVETDSGAALPVSIYGRLLFLDVNGDGLPDAIEPDESHQLLTYLNTGRGFAPPVSSLPSVVLAGADGFLNLASAIDYDGDGRQDLLLPLSLDGTSSAPAWIILQATGGANGATFAMVDPHIPLQFAVDGMSNISLADPRGPRVTDIDGDGAQDVLIAQDGFYTVFRSAAADQDVLTTVTDGMNAHDPGDPGFEPNVVVTYGHLVDRSITDGLSPSSPATESYAYLSRHDDNNLCAYPRHCVVGPRRAVKGYALNNGADKLRHFDVAYHDGRFHRLGRGFLGFGGRVVTDRATRAGVEEIFDNRTHDADLDVYPNAGQIVHERRWSPALPSQPDTVHIELAFADVDLTTVKTYGGKTYFTLPTRRRIRREQGVYLGGSATTAEQYAHQIEAQGGATVLTDATTQVGDYDAFGNVRAEATWAAGVDLVSTITRTYANNTTTWLLGKLKTEAECSAAGGLTQCRTILKHYDVDGQLYDADLGSTDADGGETKLSVSFQRDLYGNVVHTGAVDGFGDHRMACTTYEPEGIFPFARGNAAGHLTFTRFDPGLGVLTAAVDPNGLTTRWAHDGFGRVTEELRPDQSTTTYALARKKTGAWKVRLDTVTAGGEDETVEYDSLARPVRRLWHGPQIGHPKCSQPGCPTVYPERLAQRIVFDDLGEHVARRSLPASEGTPENALLDDRYQYDALGRVVLHTTPWNADTYYDHIGATVEVQDPLGLLSYVYLDGLGRTTSVVDKAGGTTAYGHGPFGLVTTVTAPDQTVTTTQYDAWGRVKQLDDPDRGTTLSQHDGFGQLVWSKDALGREASFSYDALGRGLGRVDVDSAGTHTTTWTWDTAPLGQIPGAKALGGLAGSTSPDGVKSYSYDDHARPVATTLTVGGESFTTTLTYGVDSRVDRVAYPTSAGVAPFVVQHGYDDYGHLIGVSDVSTGSPYWRFTDVDDAGRLRGETFGNGVVTTRGYFDDKQRVKSIFTTHGSATIQDLGYDYDVALNLASRHDALQAQHPTERFGYDLLDRLTCAYFGESAQPSPACAVSYGYDAIGNLTLKSDLGSAPYVYDALHHHPHAVVIAGGTSFTYDAVGNQRSRSGTAVAYTPFDLPKTFTPAASAAVTLDYDADQQRIRKSVAGGDVTVYLGDLYERVAHAAGSTEHRYHVHAGARLAAVVTRGGSAAGTLYVHADNLGSIDVLTKEDGSVVERRSYEAFGARRDASWGSAASPGPALTTMGFTGHESEEDLGVVNMKGRIYDPKLGRFLTPDPIVAHPGVGQSWNPYSYVLNNPLRYTDPSGFQDHEVLVIIGPPPPPPPETPKADNDTNTVPSDTGAAKAPNDVGTVGTTSGYVPQPTATAPNATILSKATGIGLGVVDWLWKSEKVAVLNVLTAGYYSSYASYKAIGQGYHDDGALGAVNAVNPLYQVAKGGVDTAVSVERGDYRGAGSSGAGLLAAVIATVITSGKGADAVEAVSAAEAAAASDTAALLARAQEVHAALPADGIAASMRTTAALDTMTGAGQPVRVLGSGGYDLTRAQKALAGPGEVTASLRGAHAEVTVLRHAAINGLLPRAIATTRDICPRCAGALTRAGATITGPRTAVWP